MTSGVTSRPRRFGPSRADVLEHLRRTGAPQPVAAIAAAVGLHANTTRFHLEALIAAGQVHREAEIRQKAGRPRVLYRAEPTTSQELYQDFAGAMVRHFAAPLADRGRLAEAAGMAWGEEVLTGLQTQPAEALPRLVGCLARMGYQPELIEGPPPSINVHPCPYADLAEVDPETVCRMHLGLLRGLLHDDDPWEVTALEPYATPDLCIVRLAVKDAPT